MIVKLCRVAGIGLLMALNHLAAQTPVAAGSLIISPVIDGDKADYGLAWRNFQRDLQTNLDHGIETKGMRVEVNNKPQTASQQLAALASGAAPQIFALSCGNTATALLNPSRYRYQTSFVLGDARDQPLLYRPIFIVTRHSRFSPIFAACSNITQFAAVLDRNTNLPFGMGDPNSLSSYRIPMLVMIEGDHKWTIKRYSRQNDLIKMVVSGRICAACVADDVLRLSGNWGNVQEIGVSGDGVNPILTNGFPAISFGWRSDLPQNLQNCISNTFANHVWARDDEFTSAYTGIKSVPVSGIVKIAGADRLWDDVIQIMKLPVPLPDAR